ncbi:MAG: hypothetical protein ABMA02_19200 [Saprospiraceae bacterium]
MNETNWQDILADIEEQQAVLLLGHGFLPGAQQDLNNALHAALGKRLLYFYEKEGFFSSLTTMPKPLPKRKLHDFTGRLALMKTCCEN